MHRNITITTDKIGDIALNFNQTNFIACNIFDECSLTKKSFVPLFFLIPNHTGDKWSRAATKRKGV